MENWVVVGVLVVFAWCLGFIAGKRQSTPRKRSGYMTIDQYVKLNAGMVAPGEVEGNALLYSNYDPEVIEQRLFS
jgi:hypothetical protein